MLDKIKSRKFIVFLLFAGTVIASMVSGDVVVGEGLDYLMKGVIGYFAGQGLPDAAKALMPALGKLLSKSESQPESSP